VASGEGDTGNSVQVGTVGDGQISGMMVESMEKSHEFLGFFCKKKPSQINWWFIDFKKPSIAKTRM
jgi:hypothetical protein